MAQVGADGGFHGRQLPIIAALRSHFRPVAILCQGHLGRLAAAERLVDAWFAIEAAWAASLFTSDPAPEARRALAPYTHHLVLSKSAILAASLERIAGARIGRLAPRPPAGRRRHVAEHVLSCLRGLGWLPEGSVDAVLAPPLSAGARPGAKTVLLHPGAGSPRKRWPLAGFLDLAARIEARRLGPEFVIGPAEHDLLAELERRTAVVHRPADGIELLGRMRSAAAYIGNDSGASHLAGWAGLPSVVIFGPTDPARWGVKQIDVSFLSRKPFGYTEDGEPPAAGGGGCWAAMVRTARNGRASADSEDGIRIDRQPRLGNGKGLAANPGERTLARC